MQIRDIDKNTTLKIQKEIKEKPKESNTEKNLQSTPIKKDIKPINNKSETKINKTPEQKTPIKKEQEKIKPKVNNDENRNKLL